MNTYLLSGIILGFSAGITPGPLLTLVISQTLKHSLRDGIKVALAPILTDLPIILLTFLLLSRLAQMKFFFGIISILGGFFVLYLAQETFFQGPIQLNLNGVKPQSIRKGIMTNLLSPHPYLFWFSVGVPLMIKGANESILNSLLFAVSFFLFIIGSKIAIALIMSRWKNFLSEVVYLYTMKFLGVGLLLFAILLFREGVEFFKK